MTKDEAINVLKNAALIGATWIGDEKQFNDLLDAVKMAVEALKQANNSNMSNTSNTLKSLDCVDRQAAIDAIESAKTAQTPDGEIYVAKINAEMNIQILPSVQPEIVPCGDCKHWICHDRRCGYWNHGVQPLMWCSQAERRWKE